jgi:hypothetical protein
MNRKWLITLGSLAVTLCASAENQTNIDTRAERVLRSACDYLAEAPHFSVIAEVWREQMDDSGQKVQFTRTMNLRVKRPNRLHMEIHSPQTQRAFWYDGHTLTELDCKQNLFSTMKVPGTIDGALDVARDEFGIDLPLIDLALSNPYKNATAKVEKGTYFGLAQAMGFECHHLAFTQDNIDWQIWIENGPQPLIRKFVITHKNESGAPEFTALITVWDFLNRIAESDFVFEPPSGCIKIEMRKSGASEAAAQGSKSSYKHTGPKQKS